MMGADSWGARKSSTFCQGRGSTAVKKKGTGRHSIPLRANVNKFTLTTIATTLSR